MQPFSASSSQLPTLRQDHRRSSLMGYDGPPQPHGSAGDGSASASHVSNPTIANSQRSLLGDSHLNISSRDSYSSSQSTSPRMHNVLNADAADLGVSCSSGKNSVSSSITTTALTAVRLRFSPKVLPHQRQQQLFPQPSQQLASSRSMSHSPNFTDDSAAVPHAKLDIPAQAQLSHLEYTSQAGSLPPQSYLPELQPAGAGCGAPTTPADGMVALQEATTGLLVRHLTPKGPRASSGRETSTVATAVSTPTDVDRAKSHTPPGIMYEAARTKALMKAAPFTSAALLDVGVDDRINPFLLDKMIRQGHRLVNAAAKAAPADAKRKMSNPKMRTGLTPKVAGSHASAALAERKATASKLKFKGGSTPSEIRFHEPPALQAAYKAVTRSSTPAGATERGAGRHDQPTKALSDVDAFAEIVAEYASDAQNEEAAGTPRSAPLLQEQRMIARRGLTSTQNRKTMVLMSSPDYTRLASAASANDGAFVRQLVNYYTTRARATAAAAAAASQKSIRAGTKPTRLALTSSAIETVRNATGSGVGQSPCKGTIDAQSAALLCANEEAVANGISLLDAVLSVSREYVEVQASEIGLSGKGTAILSERRRHLLSQLITLDQTRIPESLWVTCAPPLNRLTAPASSSQAAAGLKSSGGLDTTLGDRLKISHHDSSVVGGYDSNAYGGTLTSLSATAGVITEEEARAMREQARADLEMVSIAAAQSEDNVHSSQRPRAAASTPGVNTIFPAVRPTDRSQVYLLADVLDRMLHDPSHPQWVELLSDPEVARYVYGEEEAAAEAAAANAEGNEGTGPRVSRAMDDHREALWGPPGDQQRMAYTEAARQVLEILDTGLSELVRQVTCHCTERGALLDLLRQSVVDIAATQVHLLGQVKGQARQDAATALAMQKENKELREQLAAVQRELAEMKETHAQLLARIEPIQQKSNRLDELMARVASKAQLFETHCQGEHIALLQFLEESMKQSASAAADNFYNEVNDMHVRHATGGDKDAGHLRGIPLSLADEMPSVTAARAHAAEQRQTMERMYTESHQLLRTLQDAVDATNAVCSPLYRKMILTGVSPVANVASSRWTAIARAVGAFEKDRRHRQRVYEVFTEYCTVFRHQQAAARDKANNKDVAHQQTPSGATSDSNTSARDTVHSYGESFLVENSPSKKKKDAGEDGGDGASGEDSDMDSSQLQATELTTGTNTSVSALAAVEGLFGSIITYEDLVSMSATDCTVNEVNALFTKNFDIHAYLRGSWEDYINDRRLQDAASGIDDAYTLRLSDLLQMLCDLQSTLSELTMRIRAVADSGVLQTLLRPPLEPPAHPEVPCPLCRRRDTCETDRQRRREAMSRIARDLQGKMDAVETKSRAAQLERDEARREVRRLQMELQQVSNGNVPMLNQVDRGKPKASMQHGRNSSITLLRGRRDTSTPRPSPLPRDPLSSMSSLSRRGSNSVPRTQRTRQPSRTLSVRDTQQPRRRSTREGGCDSDTTDVSVDEASAQLTTSLATLAPPAESVVSFLKSGEDEEGEYEDLYPKAVGGTASPSSRRDTSAIQ
ncbi:hypothetical protein ABL78_1193 [Leptomonas seymouri]|uniref:Uncharacterized protein n=1 Tax=Leptomonas seymouri TaxID=5684 RepID=A0A0N1IMF4_LEPSE|nr:hypothetical protein ABL78_1193 [Leptomonas seymouri]|eukprot:KPI89700.1 hypothetical protein ABL78_1193 [Leptomonas seymouri]